MPADPLWIPAPASAQSSHMSRFVRRHAPRFADAHDVDYRSLHRWSVEHPADFWGAAADYCGLALSAGPECVVADFDRFPGARWFPGARLNYAENLLSGDRDRTAILFSNERGARREMTLGELQSEVAAIAHALRSFGVGAGHRVAGILPNSPECVIAALATASLGGVWSSCSPDFGEAGLYDRLSQIEPCVVFGVDGYSYAGKTIDCRPTLDRLIARLPSVRHVIVSAYVGDDPVTSDRRRYHNFGTLSRRNASLEFTDVAFDDPLFIMFSSGTTGPPKCIVHGVGGTLLQHLKEHQLHCDIRDGDHVFYYTTTGWMMWNWLVSALASGASLVLYDGSPMHPGPDTLWRLAETEEVAVFGTSARYLSALEKQGCEPAGRFRLQNLRAILSTGSPLAPASFDYVYRSISGNVHLASIAGGTDLISCFVLGNPMLPVYRGEIQCAGLGMDVRIVDAEGHSVVGQKGELVCGSPFPSMPVGFWNDPTGEAYRRAYFERYSGAWHHGDFAELTDNGGFILHGRSDATLNPGGIRIGTAEIYRIVEQLPQVSDSVVVAQEWDGDTRIVLFVVMNGDLELDDETRASIRAALRSGASPRHVPARIVAVRDIPKTLSGKISERAVIDAIHGRTITNREALANPDALEDFTNRAELLV